MRNTSYRTDSLDKVERAWWDKFNNPSDDLRDTAKKFKVDRNILYQLQRISNNFKIKPNDDMIKEVCEKRYEYNREKRKAREEKLATSSADLFSNVDINPNSECMTLNEYQKKAESFCLPESDNPMYAILGLAEEVGELQGKVAKAVRKAQVMVHTNNLLPMLSPQGAEAWEPFLDDIKKKLGDILWFVAHTAHTFKWELGDVAQMNVDKLTERKQNDTIVTHQDH